MYRLYYKHMLGNLFTKKRTCFNSIQELLTEVCKWNSKPKSLTLFIPIDWEAVYITPLDEEIFPNSMECRDDA